MTMDYISITPLMGQVTAVSLGSLCISSLSLVLLLFLFFSQAQLNFLGSSSPAFLPLFGSLTRSPFSATSNLFASRVLHLLFPKCQKQRIHNSELLKISGKELNYKLWLANTSASLTVTQ